MKDLLEICCGLDVHRDTIVACLLKGKIDGTPSKEIRTFSTLLSELDELKIWLEEEQCRHVAMESTGVYWYPVYSVLEGAFEGTMAAIVTNARHMKNLPGKKTDIKDAEWIVALLRAGLLQGSFIPSEKSRNLRELTRYRTSIVQEIASQKNRVEKYLQSYGFKLSTFLADIFGVSGRRIINYLAEPGEICPEKIQLFVKGRARLKTEEIKMAVNGRMGKQQREVLTMLLKHLDENYEYLNTIETKINEDIKDFKIQIEQLDSVPGISTTAAAAIIAEIGVDMSKFKTSDHICSWAGLSLGNNESSGKKKSTHVTKGNPYIKTILCEVAWAITRVRSSYLSSWYWKMKQRLGTKKAIIALARKLLVIIYNMIKTGNQYDENIFSVVRQRQEETRKKKVIAEAKKLGLTISDPVKIA